jgi:hypothetical protein
MIEIFNCNLSETSFIASFFSVKENKIRHFCVQGRGYSNGKELNQLPELVQYINQSNHNLVGFNIDNYDYPMLHHIIKHQELVTQSNTDTILWDLKKKSNDLFAGEFNTIGDQNKYMFVLDLFKVFHLNTESRSSSLKDVGFALNCKDINVTQHQYASIEELKQIGENKLDICLELYKTALGISKNKIYKGNNIIKLRQDISRKYDINCLNLNDTMLGYQIVLKLYSDKVGISRKEIKSRGGTSRSIVFCNECIPKFAKFTTDKFKGLLYAISNTKIVDGVIKNQFSYSVIYNECKLNYGLGGLHASCKQGVYKSSNEFAIVDIDINSLYPMLACYLEIYPEHLGHEFLDVYKTSLIIPKLEESKKENPDLSAIFAYKKAANSIYGKSNESKSFVYDPLYMLKTTIAGQIFISMWIEKICESIENTKILFANTDGLCLKIPRNQLDKLKEISDEFTKSIGLSYKNILCKSIALKDVNNYIEVREDGSNKSIGAYSIYKDISSDNSARIVRIALSNYFINGVPLEETIRNSKNIFDFCIKLKVKAKTQIQLFSMKNGKLNTDFINQNTLRYYISNRGFGLKSNSVIKKGFNVTNFNRYEEKEDYDINYKYYIAEAYKLADSIIDRQQSLFE